MRPLDPSAPSVANTPDRLAHVLARVTGSFAEARRSQVWARFAAGDAVNVLRQPAGSSGEIRALAACLDIDESGLMRLARTSALIHPPERLALLGLNDARGLPLSWSHLELLARARGADRRLHLAQCALAEGISVRELRERLGSIGHRHVRHS